MIPSGTCSRVVCLRRVATAAVACSLAVCSIDGSAQITSGSGSKQPGKPRVGNGHAARHGGTTVHESQAPQSKDAAGKNHRATAGKGHKTEGAGSFNNGLYGTGAGSNK